MRISLFILGVFAALVCFEKPATAQNYPLVCLLRHGHRCHELWVRNISTMFGRR